jgi:hypothetical protein
MSDLRLDQVDFTTMFEAPQNYLTGTASLVISGNVTDGSTKNFSTTIPYTRSGTRADVYLDGNNTKVLANSGPDNTSLVYTFVSSETIDVLVQYSTTDITILASIFNGTGAPITLTTQTITVSAVLYDAPIGSL